MKVISLTNNMLAKWKQLDYFLGLIMPFFLQFIYLIYLQFLIAKIKPKIYFCYHLLIGMYKLESNILSAT